jgi:PAS domain S-box-containing protein
MLNAKAKSISQPKHPVPFRTRHSIRTRLLVALGGTLLILLGIVVASLYHLATTIERTSWQERQFAATLLVEQQFRAFISQAERSMKFVTNNLQAISLAGRFLPLTNAHPAFMELVILDTNGQILVESVRTATPAFDQDLPQTKWFQATRSAEPNTLYIDKIAFSDQNEPYTVIALRAETGETMAAAISLTFVGDVLGVIRFGETGQGYVVTATGDIVAHTDASITQNRVSLRGRPELMAIDPIEFSSTVFAAQTPLKIQEQHYTNFQGMVVNGTYAVIPGTEWIIFTEIAETEIFAESGRLLLPLILFAVIFWGGAMLTTSWVIGNLIFAPLARLRAGQQAIAAGNLETVVAVHRADEMGFVIEGFNTMARNLHQHIMEQQQAQATLDQTQLQMRQAADSLNGAIYQFSVNDMGWKLDYISDGVEKLCGLSAATLMQDANLVLKVVHPEDKKTFAHALQDVFQTLSNNWVYEGRLIHAKTGESRWFRAEAKLQKVETSGIVFKGVVLNITERKRFEDALRLNSKAVEASPVGIVIADAHQPDMPLVYVNPMFEKMTGYSADDALGMNCRFLQGADRQQPALDTLRHAIRYGEDVTVILRNYRKNGTMFWNELSVTPIFDMQGTITHYLGIQDDITERKLAEQQIQDQNASLLITNRELALARQQAEESSRLKSQFLATMSHELRTPLNAIIGYTQLQLAGMVGDLSDEQQEFQERVLANSQHLLHLINEVLDLSKIEAGRIELANALFNLHYSLQEIMTQNNVLAAKKGLTLSLEIADTLPEMVIGDRGRIKQIIINLVSNAIKFTDAGSITLTAARHDKQTYSICVTDTGVGIAHDKLEVIFEEFRQLEDQERGGTGLGLPIARRLARMMGGDIAVSSEVGQGSQFTVYLPLNSIPSTIT